MTSDATPARLLIDIQQAMFGPDEVCHAPERTLANAAGLLKRAGTAGIGRLVIAGLQTESCIDTAGPRRRAWDTK